MGWYQTKKASKLLSLDKSKILVFDTETTGFHRSFDEIIQISILDGCGLTLYSSYIRPKRKKTWKKAEKVNHINYEMVKDCPTIDEEKEKIQEIFNNADLIVGYNVNFDINFLENAGIIVVGKVFDVMWEFARYRADVENQRYVRFKLVECAEYFGYSFEAHDAEKDAGATLYCFDQLLNDPRFTEYNASKKREYKEKALNDSVNSSEIVRIEFSFQGRTRRSSPLFIKGMIMFGIGEIIYYLYYHDWIMSQKKLLSEIIRIIRIQPSSYIDYVPIVLMSLGAVVTIIGIIIFIIKIPKWIIVFVKRLILKFK